MLDRAMVGSSNNFPLLVVAGEPSGDRAASRVVAEISSRHPCEPFGIGGPHSAAAGVALEADIDHLVALGIGESLRRMKAWLEAWTRVRQAVDRRRPKVALLVDAPEVNLPLARVLTAQGIKVVFYIGPQVWAWRPGRLNLLRERTDIVALVLPFEKPIYDQAGVAAVFVGHPILDQTELPPSHEVRQRLGLAPDERVVALLPGSRPGEVRRLAGPMLDAAVVLHRQGVRTVFAPAPGEHTAAIRRRAATAGCLVPAAGLGARQVLYGADGALVASGTATLEAAIAGTPLAVVYRTDRVSALLARYWLHLPQVGLPNWIAGERVIPELLQEEVTGAELARQALELLHPDEAKRQRAVLATIARALGKPGAALRVAELVLERLA